MQSDTDIAVLLASDIPILRGSVVNLLNDTQRVNVVACAESHDQVLPLAEAHGPNLAILDLDIDRENLTRLIATLTDQKTSALLMSDENDIAKLGQLFLLGLRGIIPRRSSPDLISRSVHAVAGGEVWLSRQMTRELVDHLRALPPTNTEIISPAAALSAPAPKIDRQPGAPVQNRYGLTPREAEIVHAIGDAMTNKDIAVHFGISEYTVKHHLTKIFDKVGVDSRLELAMFAKHHGLVAELAEVVGR